MDKFGSPTSYQYSFNFKDAMCQNVSPDTGCRGGFLCAACSVNAQHRDEMRCQLTLCSLGMSGFHLRGGGGGGSIEPPKTGGGVSGKGLN